MNKTNVQSAFYIVPHADDWQLFMNPQAYLDIISPGTRVIFVITTAGDAGMGEAFWRGREEAMKSSILYCLAPESGLNTGKGFLDISPHRVAFWSVNNVTCYFFRLPDGGIDGKGFAENNFQSLEKLEKGTGSLKSLDGNIELSSWKAFCALLGDIIWRETNDDVRSVMHLLNPDPGKNPNDHADHRATGRALLEIDNLPPVQVVLYNGYGNSCSNELSAKEIFWKTGMFAVYERTLFEKTGYSTLAENIAQYEKWVLSRPEYELSGK